MQLLPALPVLFEMNNSAEEILDDKELVRRILEGNTNAFRLIIQKSERLVSGIVFKMIANKEERKDLVQEIYMKIFQGLGGYQFKSKLSTWIGQIAFNTCISFLEKRRIRIFDDNLLSDSKGSEFLGQIAARGSKFQNDTEINLYQKELSGILNRLMEALPPLYKTLITLYHNEELSYTEIAQITGMPVGTVKNYLFRARKSLKNSILNQYNKDLF